MLTFNCNINIVSCLRQVTTYFGLNKAIIKYQNIKYLKKITYRKVLIKWDHIFYTENKILYNCFVDARYNVGRKRTELYLKDVKSHYNYNQYRCIKH